MFKLFKKKIESLINMGLVENIFKDYPYFEFCKSETTLEEDQKKESGIEQFLEGFFYVFVLNDPLIRVFIDEQVDNSKSYIDYILQCWIDYRDSYLSNWFTIMVDLEIFEYMQGVQFNKGMWYQMKLLHFLELEKYKTEKQNNKDRFGRKAYIRQTKTIIQNCIDTNTKSDPKQIITAKDKREKEKEIENQIQRKKERQFNLSDFSNKVNSFICQDCLTPQIPPLGITENLKTYKDKSNVLSLIQQSRDFFSYSPNPSQRTLSHSPSLVLSIKCQCEKQVALVQARKYRDMFDDMIEIKLINKKSLNSLDDDICEEEQVVKIDKSQVLKSIIEPTFPIEQKLASDLSKNQQEQGNPQEEGKKKRKKRKNKKKKKKEEMLQQEIKNQLLNEIEKEEEDYYDEDFEENLKMFEQRLTKETEGNTKKKLKPNVSQEWLDKIKSNGSQGNK